MQQRVLEIAKVTRDAIARLDADGDRVARICRSVIRTQWKVPCDYPHNWCWIASYVLGRHLARELKRTDIYFREGATDQLVRHAWIRLDDIDVDITADQFDNMKKAVVVEKDSAWHKCQFSTDGDDEMLFAIKQCARFERAVILLDAAVSRETDKGLALRTHK